MADSGSGVPWRSPTLQVVLASTLLAPLGVPLVSPALPAVQQFFGVSDARASLLVSGYFLTGIVLSPFIGLLADRVGRRRVLLVSLVGFSLAGAAVPLLGSFTAVLGARVVQGTAAAGIFITTVTVLGDSFEGLRRNTVLGANAAVLGVGAAVYPIVGGALVGLSWDAPFVLYAAGLPVALFAFLRLDEPHRVAPDRSTGYLRRALGDVARLGPLALFFATFLTELLLFGTVLTALPFLLTRTYELSPVLVGGTITAGEAAVVATAAANGRLAARVSDGRLVAAGFVLYGVGLVGAFLAGSPAGIALGVVVVGAGGGLLLPSVDAALTGLVSADHRAGALSIRNSTTFLGRATGPVLFASLAATYGYAVLLLAAGVVALGVGTAAFLLASTSAALPEA